MLDNFRDDAYDGAQELILINFTGWRLYDVATPTRHDDDILLLGPTTNEDHRMDGMVAIRTQGYTVPRNQERHEASFQRGQIFKKYITHTPSCFIT